MRETVKKELVGRGVSDKNDKTITVLVETSFNLANSLARFSSST